MSFQSDRFGPKQVETPETIFGVTQNCKPRRAIVGSGRLEVFLQDSANDILVEVDTKGIGNLFSDSRATAPGIATLELDDCLNYLRRRAFRPGFALRSRREEIAIFLPDKSGVHSK